MSVNSLTVELAQSYNTIKDREERIVVIEQDVEVCSVAT